MAFFHDRLTRAIASSANMDQLDADLRAMTELHQREEKLVTERRVFAALVENSSDFIGVTDAQGKPIYVNPAGRRMVGLSPDYRIEETQIRDYYPPSERSFAAEMIVKSVVEKGQWQGETYLRNWQTEEAIPVSDKHFMIHDPETGEPLGIATITRDISELRQVQDERRRSNEELIDAREFLENVLEMSSDYSIIAKDLERRVVVWNKGAARNYGYEAGEIVGQSSDVLHAPEDVRSGAVAALHQRAFTEGHASGLFRRRRKDGSEFLARVFIARVTAARTNEAKGKALGYLLVSYDVTAEQRHVAQQQFLAEVGEALQASLDYETSIERIAQLVVGFMGDCCAIDVVQEDGTLRRTKVLHADPTKTGLAAALAGILPGRTHPIWSVLETRQPLLFTEVTRDLLRWVAKNEGHLRLLEALGAQSAVLLPLVARGRILAVLTVVSCRPDRRYRAEDMRFAEELARRASLALDNARLYEVAQEAIQARDLLMGIVAHDLRNPLGTIRMQTSLLRRRGGEPERRSDRSVDRIDRAATRMNRLIEDLLDVTRIEAGHLTIEQTRVLPGQVVSESVEAQTELAATADLELRVDLQEDLPDVWADRDRLLQVFENIICNAVNFTKPGGRILVGAALRAREVLFSVSDTGSGIAAEDLPHVFERHWQTNKAAGHGAGLGLPIVKGIVEAHSGQIWVKSTPGQGSTFFFTIPTTAPAEEWHAASAPHGP